MSEMMKNKDLLYRLMVLCLILSASSGAFAAPNDKFEKQAPIQEQPAVVLKGKELLDAIDAYCKSVYKVSNPSYIPACLKAVTSISFVANKWQSKQPLSYSNHDSFVVDQMFKNSTGKVSTLSCVAFVKREASGTYSIDYQNTCPPSFPQEETTAKPTTEPHAK